MTFGTSPFPSKQIAYTRHEISRRRLGGSKETLPQSPDIPHTKASTTHPFVQNVEGAIKKVEKKPTAPPKKPVVKKSAAAKKPAATNAKKAAAVVTNNSKPVKQVFLDHIHKLDGLGMKGSVKTLSVAQACGYKSVETKSFRSVKKMLKDEGLIQISGDTVQLTEKAIAKLPKDTVTPKSNGHFHTMIKDHFGNDKNIVALVDALADGGSHSNLAAAQKLGYKSVESHGFRDAKKALKEVEFLEGTKQIQLTDKMFPHGRP